MKKVLVSTVLALSCLAVNAFAVDASSSWEEINKDASLYSAFPVINFANGVSKQVASVCLEADGETLNGGTASVCAKYQDFGLSGSHGRTAQCVEFKTVELKKSINQTDLQCFRWGSATHQDNTRNYSNCLDLREVPVKIALNYSVDVYNQYPAGLAGPQRRSGPIFTKGFAIPACAAE